MASYEEDIFKDDSDDNNIDLDRQEWERVKDARYKEGYRDGFSAGQEKTLQTGFNEGYTMSFRSTFTLAKFRGIMCAFVGEHKKSGNATEYEENIITVETLIEKISTLEQTISGMHSSVSSITSSADDKESDSSHSHGHCGGDGGDCSCRDNSDSTSANETTLRDSCSNVQGECSAMEVECLEILEKLNLMHLIT